MTDHLPSKECADPSVALAILKGIVSYWNEFGAAGIDELMHYADRYLRNGPAQPPGDVRPEEC
jgi:hypothetical protein